MRVSTEPPVRGATIAFVACVFLVSPYVGLDSFEVDPRIAEVWPVGGTGFVLLTTVWWVRRAVLAAVLAAMVAVVVVTAVLLGSGPLAALWLGVMAVVQSLLMLLAYRRLRGRPGFAPEHALDVGAMLLSAAGSALVVGLLGGYPRLAVDEVASEVLLWWVLRSTVFCFGAAVIFTVLLHTRRPEVLRPSSWPNRVALAAVTVLCVVGTYHDPSLPLSWLLIVPCVWGGMTLTLRGTAYLVLYVSLVAAGMTYLPQNQFGYGGLLPAASIVDLLVIASTAFALLLALMREQRARLIAELDHQGRESESRRQLLETVLDAMNDGVMVVADGAVQTHNTATRTLLGRPVPHGAGVSWSETFAVAGPDGRPLTDDELRRLFGSGDAPPEVVEVRVGHGAGARVLAITAKALPTTGDEDDPRVLLLHDVTAQRARLRELTNFAGMVAHDLRGPLTVLDGWLEVAEDDESSAEESEASLVRAREASSRMRQVIEDWLNYTVVQEGRLRPEPVELHALVASLVESRRSHSSLDEEPRITLDLAHRVRGDAGLLRQLLDNLVDNAVKYTAPGQVPEVRVVSRDDEEPGWVRVEVVDAGVGIPEGQEELIFEEFHTGPVAGRSQGTGLGLALTRRIVALHGGTMAARRNEGGGSTFSFTVPAG